MVGRRWFGLIFAGMLLIASAVSAGDKEAVLTAPNALHKEPPVKKIATFGLIGALLTELADEPTQNVAVTDSGESIEVEEVVSTSESSPTTTGISAGS